MEPEQRALTWLGCAVRDLMPRIAVSDPSPVNVARVSS